jgi:glycosyltransferase involved in cell wall biosynthesis
MDYYWLPRLIKKTNPNIVLSLTNIPARTNYAQIFLHDNPYFLEKKNNQFHLSKKQILLQKIRSALIKNRLKFVDTLVVQSEYQKKLILPILHNKTQMQILPPSTPKIYPSAKLTSIKLNNAKIKLLCLSRYYEHKNLEILIRVGRLIKEKKLSITIYITIDYNQHKNVKAILKSIKKFGLDKTIINIGTIEHNAVPQIIKQCDAMVLPSLLESFSLTFIEAWFFQKPLFVSDIESIRNTCKKAAIYFNPSSHQDILETIIKAFDMPDRLKDVVNRGIKRCQELPNWKEYIKLIKSPDDS